MKRFLLDRRMFLKAGGLALAVPYLEAMFPAKALAGTSITSNCLKAPSDFSARATRQIWSVRGFRRWRVWKRN